METLLVISNILLWFLIIVQIFLFFIVVRSVREFIKRFPTQTTMIPNQDVLVLGQKAPLFSVEDHQGAIVSLNKNEGYHTLLFFASDNCPICQKIVTELKSIIEHQPMLRIIVISPENQEVPTKQVPQGILFVRSNAIFENYRVKHVPYAILVNKQGYIMEFDYVERSSDLFKLVHSSLQEVG